MEITEQPGADGTAYKSASPEQGDIEATEPMLDAARVSAQETALLQDGQAVLGDGGELVPDGKQTQLSDTRYRQMFERNLAIKLLIDPATGEIVDANAAASQFYGYSLDELLHRKIDDINILPLELIQQEMNQAASEKRNYFVFRHRLKSGEVRDVEVYSSPLEVDGRHLLFSIVHDITERKQAEAETQRSLSLLRATLDSTADGIIALDERGWIVTYNRKFCQIWHIPGEALLSMNQDQLLEFVAQQAQDPAGFASRVQELNNQPDAESYDILKLKDGRVIERYSQPQKIGNAIAGRVWSFRDITARVRAEENIRQLNADLEHRVQERTAQLQALNRELEEANRASAQLAAIVHSSDDMILSKDLDGIVTSWNAGAERIYGYTADEIIGKPVSILMPSDHADDFPEIMSRIRRGESVDHYETKRMTKDGRVLDMSVTVSPMKDASGTIVGASAIARDITEKKRLEDQLRAEHKRLASLVANVDVALMLFDAEGRVTMVNECWVRRNRMPASTILGRRYDEIGDNAAVRNAQAVLDGVLSTGKPAVLREVRYQATAGEQAESENESRSSGPRDVYIDASVLPMRDASGKITGAMAVTIDVTEKVLTRQEIEEQKALLQTILETTPVGIVYYDRDVRIVDCNAAWERMSDIRLEDARGRSLYDLFPVTRERENLHRRVLAGEVIDQQNVPFVRQSDGQTHYYNISYRPIRGADGEIIGILNTVTDVTESVLTNQEIERQREVLNAIIEGSPIGIALFDNDMRVIDFNTNWAMFTGVDAATAGGRSLYDISPASEEVRELHRRVLAGENVFLQDGEYTRPGETQPRYYDIYYKPLPDPNGAIAGLLMAAVDVTHRRELDRQKDDFLALASHELKTPITTIKGSAQVALRTAETLGNERLMRMLGIVEEQANRVTRLINELLDVTHAGAGSLAVHMEPLDLRAPVEEVAHHLELSAPDFTVELRLPQSPVTVLGDRQRLEQVVTNLVHNAIKYSGESRKVEVELAVDESSERGPEAVVSVRDYGVGVPADQQPQVFERFFRGRNVDAKHYDGLGLGLFISHGIVSGHGGRMWLQSAEGEGSTFYFALPLITATDSGKAE